MHPFRSRNTLDKSLNHPTNSTMQTGRAQPHDLTFVNRSIYLSYLPPVCYCKLLILLASTVKLLFFSKNSENCSFLTAMSLFLMVISPLLLAVTFLLLFIHSLSLPSICFDVQHFRKHLTRAHFIDLTETIQQLLLLCRRRCMNS